MKFLFRYLRPFIPRMTLGLAIKIAGTLMDLIIPYILEYIIDSVIPTGNAGRIVFFGCIMLLCSAGGITGNVIANRMASAVARDTTGAVRHDLFAKILRLSPAQIDSVTIPTLETRLTSDTYNLHTMTGMMQRLGVRAPILLIGGIAVTFAMEPVLSLTLILILPFITAAVFMISKKGIPLFRALQKSTDDMTGVVRESAQGIRVIKALSKAEYEKEKFDRMNRAVADAELKSGRLMSATNPLMSAFLNLGMAAVILVGAYRVNGGRAEAGMVIAFMSYFTIVLNAMLSVTRLFTIYSKGAASAARIGEIMEMPDDLTVLQGGEEIPGAPAVEFRNVSFAYPGKKDTLSEISFRLGKGQTLGLIGATGSGKSTVIQLLLRFYDVSSGQILINGRDIRTFSPAELRRRFGTVLQNDFIFEGTVLENIDFGRGIPEESIKSAAECAQADFIERLADGFESHVNSKGTNLSGGQKQRLLISRALSGDPEILLLDDSSSALDYATDAKLRSALRTSYSSATKLIVAQRVSSVMNADLIIVLDSGRVIGMGTHDELLETCPVYRGISDSQIGGEAC